MKCLPRAQSCSTQASSLCVSLIRGGVHSRVSEFRTIGSRIHTYMNAPAEYHIEHRRNLTGRNRSGSQRSSSRSPVRSAPITDETIHKPNFENSGKLASETNTHNGVVLKYNEPPDARKPTEKWRIYVFKNDTQLSVIHLARQSCFLFGRQRIVRAVTNSRKLIFQVADIPIEHDSCSKQHAVIQFRRVNIKNDDTRKAAKYVTILSRPTFLFFDRPYIIDLESANGTSINGDLISPSRYYELKENDIVKFGFSTRDYVIIKEPDEN